MSFSLHNQKDNNMNPLLSSFAVLSAKPLVSVSPVDIAIIVIYFLFVVGIGIYLKRFTKTGEDFFMAGREMTAWIAGLSFLSAIFNEVLQFVLIWLGALLIPILGLVQAGGWSGLKHRIVQNLTQFGIHNPSRYLHVWSTLGHFRDNPMGINWIGLVFGLGAPPPQMHRSTVASMPPLNRWPPVYKNLCDA